MTSALVNLCISDLGNDDSQLGRRSVRRHESDNVNTPRVALNPPLRLKSLPSEIRRESSSQLGTSTVRSVGSLYHLLASQQCERMI